MAALTEVRPTANRQTFSHSATAFGEFAGGDHAHGLPPLQQSASLPQGRGSRWARFSPTPPHGASHHSHAGHILTNAVSASADFHHPVVSPASRPLPDFPDAVSESGSDAFGPLPSSPGNLLPANPVSLHASFIGGPGAFNHMSHTHSTPMPHSTSNHALHRAASTTPGPSPMPGAPGGGTPMTERREPGVSSRDLIPVGQTGGNGQLSVCTYDPAQSRHSLDRPTAARFRNDLMMARTSMQPMDRYKAFTRLLSSLRRDLSLATPEPFKPGTLVTTHPELLWRIIEVGEALAVIGSSDYGERTNSTRAINAKDFAYLLKVYGENFWALYRQEFLDSLPQPMADDALSVRGLLVTRFEANAIITDQLMKHVGLEGQGGGQGAVVYNTSVISANPVNKMDSKPVNHVQSYAAAASKALQTGGHRAAAIAMGVGAGLWVLKRTGVLGFIPGMGRGRGRGHSGGESDDPSTGRRSNRRRGDRGLSSEERLLLAFDHVDRSYKELVKAQRNVELLQRDWRLGPIRLLAPFGGPDPPGYEPLDLAACEPRQFMHIQLGGGF